MTLLLYIMIYMFVLLTMAVVVYLIMVYILQRRCTRIEEQLTDGYLQSLYQWSYNEHVDRSHFSRLVNGGSRRLEAHLMAQMSTVTYGHINSRMEKLIKWRHMDRMLIRRAMETRGYIRAGYLRTLSNLPLNERSIKRIRRFGKDRNRYVRLFALLAQINYAPDRIVEIMSEYKCPMGGLELARITMLLRRKFVPVSIYEELLASCDRNMIMLGLYIIRLFRVESAAQDVARLIPSADKVLRNTVLITLIVIRSPLAQKRIVRTVSLMGERGRKRLYRFLAGEGYSLQALCPFVSLEQDNYLGEYLCNAVNGRKRKLYALQKPSLIV